jgi:hypothetical protein
VKSNILRATTMRRAVFVTAAAILTLPATMARANIILSGSTPAGSFVDLGGQGFGNSPRLLTEQTNCFESGSVAPNGTGGVMVTGDAISGSNKANAPTIGSLGWTSGSNVQIGFNSDQTGQTGITLQSMTLTLYNGTSPVDSFSLLSPVNFSATDLALEPGNGNGVFEFKLDAAEVARFTTDLSAIGSLNFRVGLAASLGCQTSPSPTCQPSNAGPESFIAVTAVPGPIAGAGLPGLVAACGGLLALARRRRQRIA